MEEGDVGGVNQVTTMSGLEIVCGTQVNEKRRKQRASPNSFIQHTPKSFITMGSRSTLSSQQPSKVQCIDRSFVFLSVVFNSGFLSWHDLSQIQSVCKEWKEIARGAMPNDAYFEEVYNYLDQWNGCNKHCWNCSGVKFADTGDEEEDVCTCDNDDGSGDDSWSSEKDADLGLSEKDPRNKHPNYHE